MTSQSTAWRAATPAEIDNLRRSFTEYGNNVIDWEDGWPVEDDILAF